MQHRLINHAIAFTLGAFFLNGTLLAQSKSGIDEVTNTDQTKVAVLCYHDFSNGSIATETTILTTKFSDQIAQLKKIGVHFLTLEEFIQWKITGKKIPKKSVLITIDDGWSSVYKYAYPILLKEQIPFTLFIYTNYLNRGGKSLSKTQLLKMLNDQASLGSHSHTHPLPPFIKQQRSSLDEKAYYDFIKQEFKISKNKLEEISRRNIDTYAYPGGYFQTDMFDIAHDLGYQLMFSVEPDFVTINSANKTLPRFIIHGDNDNHFNSIIRTFEKTDQKHEKNKLILFPEPETFTTLTPELKLDFSMIKDAKINSVKLELLGLGPVKLKLDTENKTASWKATRRLYQKTIKAKVSWKQANEDKSFLWTFYTSDKF